ncbi:probable disease resistance RPP8-like protein 2 [Salvia hispanica]|uniref:probable disease resistance RPP8-like protein 2 n=1 Tax=Salvia hispanica TaxID=49212 RepID=UPI00200953B2|nr:probable disease resistance RPP8-like protein 2 [Salvia hispanica]
MGENMAVDAVASVVLQKLRELIKDKSFASNKIIGYHLREMERILKNTSWLSLVGAADEEPNAEEIKNLRKEYLDQIYSIEDIIESFALRFTRQRKKHRFLVNHARFLKKLPALPMLDYKLRNIKTKVKKLNKQTNSLEGNSTVERQEIRQTPPLSFIHEESQGQSSSMNSVESRTNSLESSNIEGRLEIKQIHEETQGQSSSMNSVESITNSLESSDIDGRLEIKQAPTLSSICEETQGLSPSMKRIKRSPALGNIQERPPNLCSNHSFKVLSRSDASIIRERCEHSKLMCSHSYDRGGPSMVGNQGKVEDLLHRLENSDDWIIPILGELGSGKTMLAHTVYGNRSMKNKFKRAALVNIFKESTIKDILLALLNQAKKKSEVQDGSDEKFLKDSLKEELNDRTYLVMLDGVQSLNQWKRLKDAFPDRQNGSKIIITTRDEQVVMDADPMGRRIYNLEKLSPEESWTLFMKKVGSPTDPENSLKEEINKVCRGLPLNIVLLGSLLSMKQRGQWSEIVEKIARNWQASDIMNLSYNDLDHHLKLCLIYMTLFPKELDIPVRRLKRLWLAEGFIEQRQNGEFQEDGAQEYFKNLVKRSLIMVSKQRSDGSARRCRLQGALHDLLLEQGRDIRLFHVHPGSDGSFEMRRLVEYADARNDPLDPCHTRHVRSYISFNPQKKDTPAKHVNSLVSNMGKGLGLLRVLDLEGVYNPNLPDNLGDLFNLRYLGLRWTFLDKLPKSVGELPYLQTLDLKHTRIDKIPTTIWKLKNLQHLNLDEVHLDKDAPLHCRESLPDLQTLWGLSVSHESPIKNGLSKMKHLRELGISFCFINHSDDRDPFQDRGKGQSTEALVKWISELKDLQSLRLRSKDDCGKPSDLSLRPFSGLTKLSHMKLLGKLQQLPPSDQFPPHIKVLTLSLSFLSKDPMPILGRLPDLTVLRLLGNSFLGEKMVCHSESFKKLEVLKLWVLQDLKEWKVEDGAMKKLKEVNIRRCSKLDNFPTSLLEQETFKDLTLNNMPPGFKNNIEEKYHCKVYIKDFEEHLIAQV